MADTSGASGPAGFSMYQGVMVLGKPIGNSRPNDPERAAPENARPFNHKFEDIKEVHQDDLVPIVTRTEGQYQRTQEGQAGQTRFGTFSLLLRHVINLDSNEKPRLQLEIQSELLRSEFRRIARGITSVNLGRDPIVIPEPYKEIYYCRDKIKDAFEKAPTEELRQELQLLVEFQKNYMSHTMATIRSSRKHGTIDFDCLWSLFAPGETVVIHNTSVAASSVEWLATVKSYQTQMHKSRPQTWEVTVAYTGFNGRRFVAVQAALSYPAFSGTRAITGLPVYPLQFCTHEEQLKEEAIARGARYEKFCNASSSTSRPPIGTLMMHEGPVWAEGREYDEIDLKGCVIHNNPSRTISGRVIVDVGGFIREYPAFRDRLIPEDDDERNPESFLSRRHYRHDTGGSGNSFPTQPLTQKQQLMCPPFIPAFSSHDRTWGHVLIDDLREIGWDTEVFKKPQLHPELKNKLSGLVRGHFHFMRSTSDEEFVPGMGRGLVVLLRGPPGCGKAETAKNIAESLKRPLLTMSGGELGTSARDIQEKLERAFLMAARWQAIFLLDEADVLLAERKGDSVERDSLISVFLRQLEKQSGIVFLTTNREERFDRAFASRIHISFTFPGLGVQDRTLLWRGVVQENDGCRISDDEAEALGALPVDGRTIKNVMRLASLSAKMRDLKADVCFSDIVEMLPLALGDQRSAVGGGVDGTEEADGGLSAALDAFMKRFQRDQSC